MSSSDLVPGDVALGLENVTKSWPSGPEVLASTGFHALLGDTVAVVGPSGAGKSTLLAILGLLDSPTAGEYRLFGQVASSLSPAQRGSVRAARIGFIFQSFHLIPYLTATENVALALTASSISPSDSRGRSVDALESVGLLHQADSRANTLSGGEQQRVAIARAIVKRPSLLLCDEPTGSLDRENGEIVLERLLLPDECERRVTIIVTHEPRVALRCRREVRLDDGHLVESRR